MDDIGILFVISHLEDSSSKGTGGGGGKEKKKFFFNILFLIITFGFLFFFLLINLIQLIIDENIVGWKIVAIPKMVVKKIEQTENISGILFLHFFFFFSFIHSKIYKVGKFC